MAWSGQTWIEILQEGTGGTNFGTAGAGASIFPTLYGGDAFTMRVAPARQTIRTADAGNRRKTVVANRSMCVGRLNTILYPDQAAYWMTAATALTSNLLPSYSIQYFDSVRVNRFLGCTVRSITITSSADQDYVTASIEWLGQRRDATFTVFAQPAESNYSTLAPYVHVESAANITLGGTAITKYKTINFTINNVLAGTFDELGYISACYYCGRDFNFQAGPQYTATTYRTDLEAQTPLTWVLNWTRTTPAHSLTLTLNTNSYVSSIDDSLPLDGPGYQNVHVENFFDATGTPGDFTVTVT